MCLHVYVYAYLNKVDLRNGIESNAKRRFRRWEKQGTHRCQVLMAVVLQTHITRRALQNPLETSAQ